MAKSDSAKTIEIDTESYEYLRSLQEALQKILRKRKVSFSQVIRVQKAVTRLDDTLINMQLEE